MTRTTTGHPVRALRGAGVLLVIWVAYRVPAIESAFEAEVAGAMTRPILAESPVAGPRAATPEPMVGPEPNPGGDPPRPMLATPHRTVARPLLVASEPVPAVAAPATPLPAAPASTPPTTTSPTTSDRTPGDLAPSDDATRAYARLAAGDRRGAVRLFDAALASGDDPRSALWRKQRDVLSRRWSGSAYSIIRARGAIDLAVTPVLGGGQSGAVLAWTPDPLAARPLALTVRAAAAHDDRGQSAFAAIGVAWHPVAGVTLAAERLVAIGPAARGDWTARIAGGLARTRGLLDASAYGEAGVVGSASYAAIQARVGASLRRGSIVFGPSVGVWSSVQSGDGTTVDRLDLGPGVSARAGRFSLSVDYRFRVAGNAAPGSGPVATLAAVF